ncbi:hypothetical protein LTR70_005525 [Exophiala xenobiotica]|uniref:Sulfatase N-terminal domain-containing protein n=1 Tax=Lithohypha guttulata TaxID=1690604 RepID=A0ABR0JWA1_9EURO|nr:hypothetical protein LTR24_009815 [Lithohypha guttulata]KAK5318381.1 hypothetical protein LTR70_005525 [Exophiala xenobiotica]
MTDDQDLHLGSLDYQPKVWKHFGEKGTFFKKHYCTMAQCCPSRVSFLTGKAGHNTNVTDVRPPYGGYPKFVEQGLNDNYLPVWLQGAGYNTYYTGKLMNAHSTDNWDSPFPAGWTGSDFLIDPKTYIFYNATMQRNKEPPKDYPDEYSTDLISAKTLGWLDEASKSDQPFFIAAMPIGPHSETLFPKTATDLPVFDPPVPADRHKDLFLHVTVPRSANFSPDKTSGASYIKSFDQMNETVVAYNDYFYRRRLQSLQAIDDLMDAVIERVEELGLLDNTYIIYTTDNGYHIEAPTSHTDIVPTLFELAGIPLHDDFDGQPMPVKPEMKHHTKTEHINIEFWGSNLGEGDERGFSGILVSPNNMYKGLRLIGDDYDLAYMVWCTNEHELYDMKTDPGQMVNLMTTQLAKVSGYDRELLVSRLDARSHGGPEIM